MNVLRDVLHTAAIALAFSFAGFDLKWSIALGAILAKLSAIEWNTRK